MTLIEILNNTESITSLDEARKYLKDLYDAGYSYHPDDPAEGIYWLAEMPTASQCEKMNKLMAEIFDLCDEGFTNFDPYGYIIDLDPYNADAE